MIDDLKKSLMPYVARTLASPGLLHARRRVHELKRRGKGEAHRLQIFLRVDDPYSYLLVQVLESFLGRFEVQPEYHTVLHLDQGMYPVLDMWHDNAVYDAGHLARLYDLAFESAQPVKDPELINQATAALLAAESGPDYLQRARLVFDAVWGGGKLDPGTAPALGSVELQERLRANEALLAEKGHYLSATLHYGGEWYWGLDRLDHLERRLMELGAARNPGEKVVFDRTYRDFCTVKADGLRRDEPLVLYWSARSPYSYIGLERAVAMARFHDLPLEIKPVLPMMMRGMNVPQTKKMYIFLDTKREAEKLGLPYGFVADPLGAAVERCYALFEYARAENRTVEYLLSFARAVNAEGIRAETDSGLQRIVERCGLDWHKAKSLLGDASWQTWAQANLDEMFAMGCWGVPSFRYGELRFWGQDRIGLIEKAIINAEPDAIAQSVPDRCV